MRNTRHNTGTMARAAVVCLLAAAAIVASAASAAAQPGRPLSVPPPGKAATEQVPALREVGIDQKLDTLVPLDL
jgi:hypothetical protein